MTLPIEIPEALAIARAATQQPWRLDRCGGCGDQSIADVGGYEVCAPQSPLWVDSGEHDEQHDHDALADARFIATFDPPTVLALLARNVNLEEAIDVHVEALLWLAGALVERLPAPVVDELLGDAPERARPMVAMLRPAPRLALVEPI